MFQNGSAEGGGKGSDLCLRETDVSATSLTRLLGPPAAGVGGGRGGGDHALIRLPADCEEAKKKGERNNRSSSPAWCLGVNCEWMVGGWWWGGVGGVESGGSLIFIPALLSRLRHTGRPDSYESSERAENIKPLVSGRINVRERPLTLSQERIPSRERQQALWSAFGQECCAL